MIIDSHMHISLYENNAASLKDALDLFLEEMKKRKIVYRSILRDTPIDHKLAEAFKNCFHTKFLDLETKLSADIHVFGNYVSLMSYDTMAVTLIQNEAIAKSIKIYLEFMWERL